MKHRGIPGHLRGGYSLVELLIAMGSASMLIVASSSAIFIATQATDTDMGAHKQVIDGSSIARDITLDLRYALSFTERSPTAVEFTVADRDGNAADESVRYQWSGTPGDPLERIYNGNAAEVVLPDVHDFALDYHTSSSGPTVRNVGVSVVLQAGATANARLTAAVSTWNQPVIVP